MQPAKFRLQFLEEILNLLWGQWSALGVQGRFQKSSNIAVDLEAFLAMTLTFGRYDQRLFDEVMDWLLLHEKFLNAGRLNAVLKKEDFGNQRVLSAMGSVLDQHSSNSKWSQLSRKYGKQDFEEVAPLFKHFDGKVLYVSEKQDELFKSHGYLRNPVELRNYSQSFQSKDVSCLQLSLRAIFGVSARAEVLLFTLCNPSKNAKVIADYTYYVWRSVQEVLSDFALMEILIYPSHFNRREYTLRKEPWYELLGISNIERLEWVCWPACFSALEKLFFWIEDIQFKQHSDKFFETELRLFYERELEARLGKAGVLHKIQKPGVLSHQADSNSFFKSILELLKSI